MEILEMSFPICCIFDIKREGVVKPTEFQVMNICLNINIRNGKIVEKVVWIEYYL